MTGPEAIQEILDKHPSLAELFPDPKLYSSYEYDSLDTVSKVLTSKILYLFQINEVEITLKYAPEQGWQAGTEFETGLEDLVFELPIGRDDFARTPGFALLGCLWSAIVNGGWRPYYEPRRVLVKKQQALAQNSRS